MESLIEIVVKWLPVLAMGVGTFAAIATITPNTVDNKIANFLLKAINILGANFGKAKNND